MSRWCRSIGLLTTLMLSLVHVFLYLAPNEQGEYGAK